MLVPSYVQNGKKIKHCDAAMDCDAVHRGIEHCLSCGHFNG